MGRRFEPDGAHPLIPSTRGTSDQTPGLSAADFWLDIACTVFTFVPGKTARLSAALLRSWCESDANLGCDASRWRSAPPRAALPRQAFCLRRAPSPAGGFFRQITQRQMCHRPPQPLIFFSHTFALAPLLSQPDPLTFFPQLDTLRPGLARLSPVFDCCTLHAFLQPNRANIAIFGDLLDRRTRLLSTCNNNDVSRNSQG